MESETDVLILTARYGHGHLSVANAISQKLRQIDPNIKISIQDFFELTKPNSYKGIYKGYEYLVKHGSWIYNYYYYSKEKSNSIKKLDTISPIVQKKFNKWLDIAKPKVIISTFPACSGFASIYKETSGLDIPLITVITDIVAASEWIYPLTDFYCVATNETKNNLIKKGILADNIMITGIPIRTIKEKVTTDLSLIRKIPKNKKLITFIGGGLGILPEDEELYKWLSQISDIHTVIVTGNNRKLYDKLNEKIQYANIDILGYVHHMDELMNRSTLLIGKPGGITIFEAINANLPCVILKPLLGQEIENSKYLQKKGIGFVVEEEEALKEVLQEILCNRDILNSSYQGLKEIREEISPELLPQKIIEMLGGVE